MLNTLWTLMMICPVLYSFLCGNIMDTAAALLSTGSESLALVMEMAGGFMLWCGLMEVLRRAGAMDLLGRLWHPLLRRLFPGLKKKETFSAIAMNLAANMLGLGNAATPFGLKAMELMAVENGRRDVASRAMCMFMVVNSCCVQLLPTTVVTLRVAAGSAQPGAILLPTLVCSLVGAGVGVVLCLLAGKGKRDE